jgi:hypothetical protein
MLAAYSRIVASKLAPANSACPVLAWISANCSPKWPCNWRA